MDEDSSPGEPLVLEDASAWRRWLTAHEDDHDGVWLRMAKKGTTSPTALGYQKALDEALCGGWIDGQRQRFDEHTFVQRFTPRRARSMWSKRNVEIVARLIEQERMRPRGFAEITRAQADGRWDSAYPGPATAEPPAELLAALAASPRASQAFDAYGRTERFLALLPLLTAGDEALLRRRIERLVERLEG